MSARNNKSNERAYFMRPRRVIREEERVDVRFEMVNRAQSPAQAKCQPLRGGNAHEQRTGEARAVGHGNSVQLVPTHARRTHRFVNDSRKDLDMAARRDLRHHAAVRPVQFGLAVDNARSLEDPVAHHRSGRLVAGRLYAKDFHMGIGRPIGSCSRRMVTSTARTCRHATSLPPTGRP